MPLPGRLTLSVVRGKPHATCFSCLATLEGLSEADVRDAAQVPVFRDNRLRVVRSSVGLTHYERSRALPPEDMKDRIGKKLGIDGLREDTRKWRLAQVIILIVAGGRDHRNRASTRPDLIDEPAAVPA
jgi:hypothetical protein